MKNKKIITGIIIVIICTGIAFYSMSGVLTPYVSFKDAMGSGNHVQIIGTLNKLKPVEHKDGYFVFVMKDKNGDSLNVMHNGVKPVNFEHADQVVAQGVYNAGKGLFEADKILTKCPSKYKKAE